ncbi:MAG: putative nucleic acid-binding Zn-ribbon protein [Myxococcota bacterium]|jgi:predicted  nucleic acid-binding Zn-ribbon protein
MANLSSTIPAALVALSIGTAAGGVIGYAGHAIFVQPEVIVPPPEIIKEQISEEALMALCEELTDTEKVKVVAAQEKVSSLQSQLAAKEAELATLKQQNEKDETRQVAARKKWRAMESEIESLRGQLAEAESQRDELRVELKQTLRDLDRQIAETRVYKAKAIQYKQESTANLWSAFNAEAKVEICDRGTRKRHANCHESVNAALTSRINEKFQVCVDTYQAVPVLKQAEKGDALPQFAQWLPDDNKFTKKNWYIMFCDPTLPEAEDSDLLNSGLDNVAVPRSEPDFDDEDNLDDFDLDLE